MKPLLLNMLEIVEGCLLMAAVGVTVTASPVSSGNMTTSASTTTIALTTPFPTRWQVYDKNGTLCMLMDFGGTLTHPRLLSPLTATIPSNSKVSNSYCDSKSAVFILTFSVTTHRWTLNLNFTKTGNSYELDGISVDLYDFGIHTASGKKKVTFFQVPIGDYYYCDKFDQSIPNFDIKLTSPLFQPFAEQTSHGNLGNVSRCRPPTTPASNVTTPASNMTTHASTTPTPKVDWRVKDKSGKACMLMSFTGSITHNISKTKNVSTKIPETSDSSKSTCNSTVAKFLLEFVAHDLIWQLELNFIHTGNLYELNIVSVHLYNKGGAVNSSGTLKEKCMQAPIGEYYSCEKFTENFQNFTVNLSSPIFQPFAQQSNESWGEEFKCGSALPSSGPNVGLIVGLVIGIIGVIFALGVTYYYLRRRTATENKYSGLN